MQLRLCVSDWIVMCALVIGLDRGTFQYESSKMSTSLCVYYSGFEVVFSACKFQALLPLEACVVYVA